MEQRLDKKYVYELFAKYIIGGILPWLIFIIPPVISVIDESVIGAILMLTIIPIFYTIIVYVIAYLWWKNYTYKLNPETFEKHFGIISLRNTNIPYERIQNININRPLLSRILGISQLHIQTAGNSGVAMAEGRLPGLRLDIAEKLRDELIRRSSGEKQNSKNSSTQSSRSASHADGL